MSKRKPPVITTSSPIGEDVDLDREDVRLKDGTRLTGKDVERLSDEIRRVGLSPAQNGV